MKCDVCGGPAIVKVRFLGQRTWYPYCQDHGYKASDPTSLRWSPALIAESETL